MTSTLSDLKTLLKATEIDLETDSQSSVTLPLTAMVAQTTQLIHNSTSQTSPTVHTSPTVSSASPSSFHSPQVPSQSSVSSPASAQSHYVPIPAMPYGFGPYSSSDSSFGMTGFYAGQDRGQSSNGNGGGSRPFNYGRNNAGGHGGGFARSGGFNGNGGGNAFTCQLCGKVGHGARTCRTLSNFQSPKPKVECQYCGRDNHTADRCFEIIGFPSNQHTNNGYQRSQQQHHSQVGYAMMASTSNGHMGSAMLASSSNTPQFWLADSGATNHMTSEVQLLQNLAPYNNGDTVQIGNGAQLNVTH